MFRLLETGGTVVVVGATDVGKTTFCLAMANACLVRGHKCAVVDADLGQSEIGPPATVGWGLLESPASALSDIECRDLFFVGSTSPAGRLLQTVVAVQRMNAAAAAADPFVTIVDMPGLAVGPAARSRGLGRVGGQGPARAARKPAAKRAPAPVTSTTAAGSGGTYRSTRRPTRRAPRLPILTITRPTPALRRNASDSGSESPHIISSSVTVEKRYAQRSRMGRKRLTPLRA